MQGSLGNGVFIPWLPCSQLKCGVPSILIPREKGWGGVGPGRYVAVSATMENDRLPLTQVSGPLSLLCFSLSSIFTLCVATDKKLTYTIHV